MREEIEIKGSVDYDKISGRPISKNTDTPSEGVYTHDSVYTLYTVRQRKFRNPVQRISEEHRIKAEEVAEAEGRKTFNEVLDVYEFCYDVLKDYSRKLRVPLHKVPEELEKYIPKDIDDLISEDVSELLEKYGVNGEHLAVVGAVLTKILKEIVVERKSPADVLRSFLVLEEVDVDEEG